MSGVVRAGRLVIGVAAMVAVGAGAKDLHAQEADAHWTFRERARIGVLLSETCESSSGAAEDCTEAPVVTSVVVDGPADRAGVRAADTLLAVDGMDVTTARGREALRSLEAGVPVVLDVGRPSGRISVEVTPELRSAEPYVQVRTVFVGPPPQADGAEHQEVRVLRLPSVRTRFDEMEVRLDSLGAGSNEFVFFQEDPEGILKVNVGDRDIARAILERVRSPREQGTGVRVAGQGGAGSEEDEHAHPFPTYVWEHEDLARRLARVRDSSLSIARVHLDSLVRLRGRVDVRRDTLDLAVTIRSETDAGGAWAYYVTQRPLAGEVRELIMPDRRVAGAEFRELVPPLAEYFEGVEEGLLVLRVIGDTPASRLGLREGDVVIQAGGESSTDVASLRRAISAAGVTGLDVKWIRKGSIHEGRLTPH